MFWEGIFVKLILSKGALLQMSLLHPLRLCNMSNESFLTLFEKLIIFQQNPSSELVFIPKYASDLLACDLAYTSEPACPGIRLPDEFGLEFGLDLDDSS